MLFTTLQFDFHMQFEKYGIGLIMEVNQFILSKHSSVEWASRVFLDVVGLPSFLGNREVPQNRFADLWAQRERDSSQIYKSLDALFQVECHL